MAEVQKGLEKGLQTPSQHDIQKAQEISAREPKKVAKAIELNMTPERILVRYEMRLKGVQENLQNIRTNRDENTGFFNVLTDDVVSALGGDTGKVMYESAHTGTKKLASEAIIQLDKDCKNIVFPGNGYDRYMAIRSRLEQCAGQKLGEPNPLLTIKNSITNLPQSTNNLMHGVVGEIKGGFNVMKGMVTGVVDLTVFMGKYIVSGYQSMGGDTTNSERMNAQIGQVFSQMGKVYDFVEKNGFSGMGDTIGNAMKQEWDKIMALPANKQADAIGQLAGNIIGALTLVKGGMVLAGKVSGLGVKTAQAERIANKFAERGTTGSKRAEQAAELGKEAARAKNVFLAADKILNGPAESLIGVVLASTFNKTLILVKTAGISSVEKIAQIHNAMNEMDQAIKGGTHPGKEADILKAKEILTEEGKKLITEVNALNPEARIHGKTTGDMSLSQKPTNHTIEMVKTSHQLQVDAIKLAQDYMGKTALIERGGKLEVCQVVRVTEDGNILVQFPHNGVMSSKAVNVIDFKKLNDPEGLMDLRMTPKLLREQRRIESMLEKDGLDAFSLSIEKKGLQFSSFSNNVPDSLRSENPLAWINKDGTISYNKGTLETKFHVSITGDLGEMKINGDTMRDYIKKNPENGKAFMEELKSLKGHESTHRLLEASGVERIAVKNKNGVDRIYLQEEICHIVDGSMPISKENFKLLEEALQNKLGKNFKLDSHSIRIEDTKNIAHKGSESFHREKEAASGSLEHTLRTNEMVIITKDGRSIDMQFVGFDGKDNHFTFINGRGEEQSWTMTVGDSNYHITSKEHSAGSSGVHVSQETLVQTPKVDYSTDYNFTKGLSPKDYQLAIDNIDREIEKINRHRPDVKYIYNDRDRLKALKGIEECDQRIKYLENLKKDTSIQYSEFKQVEISQLREERLFEETLQKERELSQKAIQQEMEMRTISKKIGHIETSFLATPFYEQLHTIEKQLGNVQDWHADVKHVKESLSDIDTQLNTLKSNQQEAIRRFRISNQLMYGEHPNQQIKDAIDSTIKRFDTDIHELEEAVAQKKSACEKNARERYIKNEEIQQAQKSPENIARLELGLSQKRAELASMQDGLQQESGRLRAERAGIENGIPTNLQYTGNITRGSDYSSSMSTLVDNTRSTRPLIEKLQNEILSLEGQLREAKSTI